jgi:hypothetical protein
MRKLMVTVVGAIFIGIVPTKANDIYISQSSSGSGNGVDCADALAFSFFNSSTNWGTGAGQIGPGTTVHICGTSTGTANSTALTFQGSGSSSAPVTLLFENGAVLTSAQWGASGAINLNGRSYIVVDGGSNGLIQNTANGTGLANSANSGGVWGGGSSGNNIEIKSLTIKNIYVRTANVSDTSSGSNSFGIALNNAGSNILVHDNHISHSHTNIQVIPASGTQTGWQIYKNTVTEAVWNMCLCTGSSGHNIDGMLVHDNDVSYGDLWEDPADNFHKDGIFIFATNGGGVSNFSVYNNYFHGAFGVHTTAHLYLSADSGSPIQTALVYNNIFDGTLTGSVGDGLLYTGYGSSNISVYNNTFVGAGPSTGGVAIMTVSGSTNLTIQNNIIQGFQNALYLPNGTTLGTVDNNIYYNVSGSGECGAFLLNGACYNSFSNWQAAGYDMHGVSSNPGLSSVFMPSNTSTISIGANLSSLGIASLDLDKSGAQRPATGSGAWDAGAYQTGSSTTATAPNPPTGLTAVVN